MTRRHRLALAIPAVLAVLALIAVVWRPWVAGSNGLVDLGPAPTFDMTDQNAKPVTSNDLRGQVQVVTYLSPFCATYCPFTTRRLAQVEERLAADGRADDVRFVAFNLAPADAGPAEMATYLRQYDVDPVNPRWTFLTDEQAEIDRVVRTGFGVRYVKQSLDGGHPDGADRVPEEANALAEEKKVDFDIVHNESLHLVGPDGVIRGEFDQLADLPVDELYDAIVRVLDAS